MACKAIELTTARYTYTRNTVIVTFINHITNETYTKEYNTRRGAAIAVTRFQKKALIAFDAARRTM